MERKQDKYRILILGGSGFIGKSMYKELRSYFEIYCTYHSQVDVFCENSLFIPFDIENNSITELLEEISPNIIISAIDCDYKKRYEAHQKMIFYVKKYQDVKFLYFSSFKVFDAINKFPSYEDDIPISISAEGKFMISIEKLLLENIPNQSAILRLPILLGFNSPIMYHLRECIKHYDTFDVYPNLVISASTISKVAQQVHYIINQGMVGIFHLSSTDLVHHDELFKNITSLIGLKTPIFKSIYSSNEDSYSAILPKWNKLPFNYQITIEQVIDSTVLNEEITSLSLLS